jgi:predicted DNA-binding transcriptional regulator YafY
MLDHAQFLASAAGQSAVARARRLTRLIQWLRAGRPLTSTVAAEALGISRRTFTRDIEHLRTVMGLPIVYDAREGTYVLQAALSATPIAGIEAWWTGAGPFEGVLNGTQSPVLLRLRPETAARLIRNGYLRHAPHIRHADGACTVQLVTSSPEAALRWALGWGCDVEVVAPQALRQRVLHEAQRMVDCYLVGSVGKEAVGGEKNA